MDKLKRFDTLWAAYQAKHGPQSLETKEFAFQWFLGGHPKSHNLLETEPPK